MESVIVILFCLERKKKWIGTKIITNIMKDIGTNLSHNVCVWKRCHRVNLISRLREPLERNHFYKFLWKLINNNGNWCYDDAPQQKDRIFFKLPTLQPQQFWGAVTRHHIKPFLQKPIGGGGGTKLVTCSGRASMMMISIFLGTSANLRNRLSLGRRCVVLNRKSIIHTE
jgi:hypothetical protein